MGRLSGVGRFGGFYPSVCPLYLAALHLCRERLTFVSHWPAFFGSYLWRHSLEPCQSINLLLISFFLVEHCLSRAFSTSSTPPARTPRRSRGRGPYAAGSQAASHPGHHRALSPLGQAAPAHRTRRLQPSGMVAGSEISTLRQTH